MIPHFRFRILFSLAGAAVLVWYLLGPVETVSRFDTMALGLLALAGLPWLALLVDEFKIGGIEAKLRAIREEAEDAVAAASDAREVAEELALASHTPRAARTPADGAIETMDAATPDGDDQAETPHDANTAQASTARLEANANDYVETRANMRSGAARTAQMTTIFASMQAEARLLGADDPTMPVWLTSQDSGQQLAAVAWLRSFPTAVSVGKCIDAIENATEPFVQYWALRALSGRVDAHGIEGVSVIDRRRLRDLPDFFARGSDRHTQAVRINRKLENASQA